MTTEGAIRDRGKHRTTKRTGISTKTETKARHLDKQGIPTEEPIMKVIASTDPEETGLVEAEEADSGEEPDSLSNFCASTLHCLWEKASSTYSEVLPANWML